jgi:hypothetical protein
MRRPVDGRYNDEATKKADLIVAISKVGAESKKARLGEPEAAAELLRPG